LPKLSEHKNALKNFLSFSLFSAHLALKEIAEPTKNDKKLF
jgi:hypothetical protein